MRIPTPGDVDLSYRQGDLVREAHVVMTDLTDNQALAVLNADEGDDDGRSQWLQIVFPNGDVMVGCFPQGDTFEELLNGAW